MTDINLEALLRDLGLGSGDCGLGVGVDKATAGLAVLFRGRLGGADAVARGGDLGAAGGRAVSVVDATSGDELGAVSGSDALGAGVVWGQGKGRDGDWEKMGVSYHGTDDIGDGDSLQARTAAAVMRTILIVGNK